MSERPAGPTGWCLLIHQLPPRPLYLRAKIRQQLSAVGAIPVKKSVYALPDTPDCVEDFQWIAEEARAGGGEAFVCRADFLDASVEGILRARSRAERDGEYAALLGDVAASKPAASGAGPAGKPALARARARLDEIRKIDFFDAPNRKAVERKIAEVEMRGSKKSEVTAAVRRASLAGKTWVTRPGIKVDRIASAWFIRRFLDPKAKFRFDAGSRAARAGEIFFDVVGGDFTHEGDRCTLETLLRRTGVRDRAASRIAEIVHDIDLKDEKFGRPEAAGVRQILAGLFAATDDDAQRLREGARIFERLHRSLTGPGGRQSES